MTAPPLAAVSLPSNLVDNAVFIAIGVVVLLLSIGASRPIAAFAAGQLRTRQVRADIVVIGRRVVTIVVILVGLLVALGFALKSANVTLFGLVLATIVAALGVQDLLKDYVSGYYVLFEHHIRIGDRITLDAWSGTVTDVRLRVTLLRGDEGDVVVVPNSELFSRPVVVHRPPTAEETKSAPQV